MLVLLFHVLAGGLAGLLFRVQTLLVLAFVVLIEAVAGIASDAAGGVIWWVGAEIGLQLGYLVGVYCRSVLARLAPGAELIPVSELRTGRSVRPSGGSRSRP
jgi:hypothetical protein